jgi:hypothetical protein
MPEYSPLHIPMQQFGHEFRNFLEINEILGKILSVKNTRKILVARCAKTWKIGKNVSTNQSE